MEQNSLRESIAQLEGEKFQMEVEVEEIRSKLQYFFNKGRAVWILTN